MKLIELLCVTGAGEFVRIGTSRGRGWCYYDQARNLIHSMEDDFLNRDVVNVCSVSKREEDYNCSELESGIAIIVEGTENGCY